MGQPLSTATTRPAVLEHCCPGDMCTGANISLYCQHMCQVDISRGGVPLRKETAHQRGQGKTECPYATAAVQRRKHTLGHMGSDGWVSPANICVQQPAIRKVTYPTSPTLQKPRQHSIVVFPTYHINIATYNAGKASGTSMAWSDDQMPKGYNYPHPRK